MNNTKRNRHRLEPTRLGRLLMVGILFAGPMVMAGFVRAASGAVTAAELGRRIAVETDRRDSGWGDATATLRMTLRNAHGEQSTRELRTRSLEVVNDGDKLLVIFDEPEDLRNTAFLSFTHLEGADDRWLYLSALERVTRIAPKDKSDRFMGSEFAYEDLSSKEVDKYTYRWLRDEASGGVELFVLERQPVDANSGYSRQVEWIDKDEYRTWKVDFYDREGDLLKTLRYLGYRQYLDTYWRPDVMRMVNHQTGESTTLEWNGYEFRTGLSEQDFDQNGLARAR